MCVQNNTPTPERGTAVQSLENSKDAEGTSTSTPPKGNKTEAAGEGGTSLSSSNSDKAIGCDDTYKNNESNAMEEETDTKRETLTDTIFPSLLLDDERCAVDNSFNNKQHPSDPATSHVCERELYCPDILVS